jgi:N-dimethylarginine dimethylaminohydrolase
MESGFLKRTFMMCEPTNYGIASPDPQKGFANKFQEQGWKEYKKDPQGFVNAALDEWHAIKETIETKANVVLLPTMENTDTKKYYDQVFTADASVTMVTNDRYITLLSKFTNTERKAEIALHTEFLLSHHNDNGLCAEQYIYYSPMNIEGTGDNIYDAYRDLIWSGYTDNTNRENAWQGRTNQEAHKYLSYVMDTPVVSVKTQNGFFHVDTSMLILPRGEIVLNPDGVTRQFWQNFEKSAFRNFGLKSEEKAIIVNRADAEKYACNSLYVGDNTILVERETSKDFKEQLKSKGYDLVELSAEHFRYSGGAFHCVTNPIEEKKVPGGYHQLILEAQMN